MSRHQPSILGQNIRRLRRDKSLHQISLAELAGVSVSVVRLLEQGTTQGTSDVNVVKLATALGTTVPELLGAYPEEPPEPKAEHPEPREGPRNVIYMTLELDVDHILDRLEKILRR